MSDKNTDTDLGTDTKEIEALYVQSAKGMAYADGTLTLQGIAPSTIIFSDRPDRVAGHQTTQEFFDSWSVGDDSFADDPPNAVISIFSEDEIQDVVVVLSEPTLDGDQMSYKIDITAGEMPASGGPSSLFIDMIGGPPARSLSQAAIAAAVVGTDGLPVALCVAEKFPIGEDIAIARCGIFANITEGCA